MPYSVDRRLAKITSHIAPGLVSIDSENSDFIVSGENVDGPLGGIKSRLH
jgi:hypothetical protein